MVNNSAALASPFNGPWVEWNGNGVADPTSAHAGTAFRVGDNYYVTAAHVA
jgi:hypothetical protein